MRRTAVLVLMAIASCAEPTRAPEPSQAPEPTEAPTSEPSAEDGSRVALFSAAVPREHFLDGFAPCHDRRSRTRFRFAIGAVSRFDRGRGEWEPLEVSTDEREVVCGPTLPMAPMLGLASLPLDETYFVVLDIDGRVEGHLVATRLAECADVPPDPGALPEDRAMACIAGPEGASWTAVPDPRRSDACTGPCQDAALALTPYRRRPPSLHTDESLTPRLSVVSGDTEEGDPPYTLRAVSLIRLSEDRERWTAIPLARTAPTPIDGAHPLALGDWLGVELEPHRTYALRTQLDGETQDVWIMVSELVCQDIMLEPPAPPGTVPGCVATERGALATYVPDPGPALDRAGSE